MHSGREMVWSARNVLVVDLVHVVDLVNVDSALYALNGGRRQPRLCWCPSRLPCAVWLHQKVCISPLSLAHLSNVVAEGGGGPRAADTAVLHEYIYVESDRSTGRTSGRREHNSSGSYSNSRMQGLTSSYSKFEFSEYLLDALVQNGRYTGHFFWIRPEMEQFLILSVRLISYCGMSFKRHME